MPATELFDLRRMSFGRLLRHFRVRRMLPAHELAKLAGISRSHVSMLERGQRRPRFRSLRGLCHALGLEGDEFAVFCDAALRGAPSHMKDTPVDDGLETVLGTARGSAERSFARLNLPEVSADEQKFVTNVTSGAYECQQAATGDHSCSPTSTNSSKTCRSTPSHVGEEKWRAPTRQRSGARRTRPRRADR